MTHGNQLIQHYLYHQQLAPCPALSSCIANQCHLHCAVAVFATQRAEISSQESSHQYQETHPEQTIRVS